MSLFFFCFFTTVKLKIYGEQLYFTLRLLCTKSFVNILGLPITEIEK